MIDPKETQASLVLVVAVYRAIAREIEEFRGYCAKHGLKDVEKLKTSALLSALAPLANTVVAEMVNMGVPSGGLEAAVNQVVDANDTWLESLSGLRMATDLFLIERGDLREVEPKAVDLSFTQPVNVRGPKGEN